MSGHPCMDFGADDELAARYGLGGAAMRYQQMGYRVLPLARASKKPHPVISGEGGVHHASADPAQAAAWWSQDPAAGIGVAAGNGLVIFDLDVKHGQDGPGEFARQLAPWLPLDNAPIARTPSGGWHVWLRSGLAAIPNRRGLLPGVDVKGDAGYVAAAPSRVLVPAADRPGEPAGGDGLLAYEWHSGCPCSVPYVPDEVIRWLASAPAAGTPAGSIAGEGPDFGALREHGLQPGSRNVDLYRLACSEYRRFGTSGEGRTAAEIRIGQVLDKTDRSGFGAAEVRTIMASALGFVRRREQDDARLLSTQNPWMR